MNILKLPYEISLWRDDIVASGLTENKVLIIGSDEMTSQSRALEPKLTSNINGTHQFSFKLYYKYIDNQTGEEADNIYTSYITNESKIKLKYDGQWYDFLVKSITEDSSQKSYTYTLEDLYINELSKTGYGITLDDELQNNIGTVQELAAKVLVGTDWVVDTNSDTIFESQIETLFEMTTNAQITAYKLNKDASGNITVSSTGTTIASGSTIYGFYPCCSKKDDRFQFIWTNGATPQKDVDRVILDDAQYQILGVTYTDDSTYGVGKPSFISSMTLSTQYRGQRYLFNQESKVDKLVNQVVKKYTKNSETYWGYTETEYINPTIIENYMSNSNSFKSSDGWKAGYYGSTTIPLSSLNGLKVEAVTAPELSSVIAADQRIASKSYIPILKLSLPAAQSGATYTIVNSGFNDNKKKFDGLSQYDKYVCYVKFVDASGVDKALPTNFSVKMADSSYEASTMKYETLTASNTYLTFNSFSSYGNGYYYATAAMAHSLTKNELASAEVKLNTFLSMTANNTYYIYDFQIFKLQNGTNNKPITPDTQTIEQIIKTNYCYYKDTDRSTVTSLNDLTIIKQDSPISGMIPVYIPGCAKRKTVNAKQSNRFNIIQEICEQFECWASFDLTHDALGATTLKKVKFHNYIGQENPIDFRYDVNVKSINRTIDSKQIVSKLIVQQNANEFAPNGICSIVQANSNPTKDSTIYNFDYYVNNGMIDAAALEYDLYRTDSGYLGFYTKLREYNTTLIKDGEDLATIQTSLISAKANCDLYTTSKQAAIDNLQTLDTSLLRYVGVNLSTIKSIDPTSSSTSADLLKIYHKLKGTTDTPKDDKLVSYVYEGMQYEEAIREYDAKLPGATALYNNLKTEEARLNSEIETVTAQKSALEQSFFIKYSRFIQEGTWQDESYSDPELYYYDAQSVAYESGNPKITYTFNVIDVSPIDEYSYYKYKIGDKTHIIDTDFFGYKEEIIDGVTYKTPIKEEIVISQLIASLDNPEQNSVKVQTYKDQFADLFQRVTATVQSVSYATGSYERAAALAQADTEYKVSYLTDALHSADTILQNAGDQSVRWDTDGITITDNINTSQKLRIVSGGILLTDDGGENWSLGITSKGIGADKITAGEIDTSAVKIMNGDEAYFRWDAFGITAYDFNLNSIGPTYLNDLDTTKGIRFDRFGIYGYSGVDGATWHPDGIVTWGSDGEQAATQGTNIRAHSKFELTEQGLYLNLGQAHYGHCKTASGVVTISKNHDSFSKIGKVSDLIYNKWNYTNILPIPEYDDTSTYGDFVEIVRISNGLNSNYIKMYDDGTIIANNVFLSGTINATGGEIAGFKINSTYIAKDKTAYGDLNEGVYLGIDGIGLGQKKFYVTKEGELFSISGKIGGFDITNDYIAKDKTTYSDTNNGVYLGTDGIGLGPGNFYVTNAGSIFAKTGTVGGWTLDDNALYHLPSGKTAFQDADAIFCAGGTNSHFKVGDSPLQGGWVLFVKPSTESSPHGNFGVTNDGILYAAMAHIKGAIYAQTGEIGGWTIDTNLYSNTGSSSIGTYLAGNGDLICDMLSPVGSCAGKKIEDGVFRIGEENNSTFVITSDGSIYGTKAAFKFNNVFFETGTESGYEGCTMYITNNYNKGISWAQSLFNLGAGGIRLNTNYIDSCSSVIPIAKIYMLHGNIMPAQKAEAINLVAHTGYGGKLTGTWVGTVSPPSSRNLKTQIKDIDDRFDIFFDNLRPKMFKYKDGYSHRDHMGFIVDEVEQALSQAKINSKECAAYRLENPLDKNGTGSLVYTEFVALNTLQIQKLKARIEELERRLNEK